MNKQNFKKQGLPSPCFKNDLSAVSHSWSEAVSWTWTWYRSRTAVKVLARNLVHCRLGMREIMDVIIIDVINIRCMCRMYMRYQIIDKIVVYALLRRMDHCRANMRWLAIHSA